MTNGGPRALMNPEHLIYTLMTRLRIIYFNIRTFENSLEIILNIQQIIWYHFDIRGP